MKRLRTRRCSCCAASCVASGWIFVSLILRAAAAYSTRIDAGQPRHLVGDQRQPAAPFFDAPLEGELVGGQRVLQEGAVQRHVDDLRAQFLQRAQRHVGHGHLLQVGDVLFQVLERVLELQREQAAQAGAMLRRRDSGSSNTSMVTASPPSISAGKPTSDCAPRRTSISSGSSPKVQAV